MKARIACLLSVLVVACTSVPPQPDISAPPGVVSEARIASHLATLREIGFRSAGSDAAGTAGSYLEQALREAGASVTRLVDGEREHLEARLPGAADGEILVLVPFPALGPGAWVDDAGVVLGLELVRVMAQRDRGYPLVVLFAEVSRRSTGPSDEAGGALGARNAVRAAGEHLVEAIGAADADRLSLARAIVVLEPQAHQPIRIARDLPSHPVFRALFREAATSLGHGALFPREGAWASPMGLQTGLQAVPVDRLVSIVDATTVLTDLQADASAPEMAEPEAAARQLAPLLEVVSEGLGQLMTRFGRIDAFSE